jgi:hypothetical protein
MDVAAKTFPMRFCGKPARPPAKNHNFMALAYFPCFLKDK